MKHIGRFCFLYIPLGYLSLSILLVLLLKWVPVFMTPLMLVRLFQDSDVEVNCIDKHWKSYENISDNIIKAVIASEDQRFYSHKGFDFEEIRKMHREHLTEGKAIRGCSTISQQTAKNCFTFCTHTWVRKAFEAYYTILIEKIWDKERIMEVYLNIVEFGPGIYGVEAASEEYFGHTASEMTEREAASLACCLPNPLRRTPQWVEKHMSKHCSDIVRAMRNQ